MGKRERAIRLDLVPLAGDVNLTIPVSGPLIRMSDWRLNGFYYQQLRIKPA